jgi:hypothetical protein
VPSLTGLLADPRHRVAHAAAEALVCCGVAGVAALRAAVDAPGGEHARAALAVAELRGETARPVGRPTPAPAPAQAVS